MDRDAKIAQIRRLQKIREIEELQAEKPEPVGAVESGARGIASGLVPFSNQIQGAAGAAHHIASMKGSEGLLNAYRSSRDSAIGKERRAAHENPAAFYPGLVGGAVAQRFVPGLNALGPIASGALSGLGSGSADLTKGEFGQASKDTALGGSIGAAFKHAPGAFGWASQKIAPKIEEFANARALKTALGSKISNFRSVGDVSPKWRNRHVKQNLNDAGKIIREEKVIGPFTKSGEHGAEVWKGLDKSGEAIGKARESLKDVDGKKIANEFLEIASSIPENANGPKLQNKIMKDALLLENKGKLTGPEAQTMQGMYEYKPGSKNPLFNNQTAVNSMRGAFGNELEKAIGREHGTEALAKHIRDKEKYGVFADLAKAHSNEVPAERARRWFSPSDYAALLAGAVGTAASGHPVPAMIGLGVGLGHKIARERGSAFSAYTAGKIADLLQQKPEFARKFGSLLSNAMQRGPAAVTATHAVLMKNPSYRQEFEQESGDENLSNTEGRPQGVEE